MAKKLEKVMTIGTEEYEVQAKSAEKVEHKFIVNQVGFGGTTLDTPIAEYDGTSLKTGLSKNDIKSSDTVIEIIAPTGGKFKGPIRVPDASVTNDAGKSNTKADGEFFEDAVLNYKDIKNHVLTRLLNTSVLYNWSYNTDDEEGELSPVVTKSIQGITLVAGVEAHVIFFNNYNAAYDGNKGLISAYIYICTDTGNIYFSTKDSTRPLKLAVTAHELLLKTALQFSVDLSQTKDYVNFQGNSDITLGVKNALPYVHGGLGGDISNNSSLAKKAEYYINGAINEDTSAVADSTYIPFLRTDSSETNGRYCRKTALTLWTYIKKKINSIFGFNNDDVLSIQHGGTGATKREDIDVGKLGGQPANYYQKKITISTSAPSNTTGSEGDIWIVWQ